MKSGTLCGTCLLISGSVLFAVGMILLFVAGFKERMEDTDNFREFTCETYLKDFQQINGTNMYYEYDIWMRPSDHSEHYYASYNSYTCSKSEKECRKDANEHVGKLFDCYLFKGVLSDSKTEYFTQSLLTVVSVTMTLTAGGIGVIVGICFLVKPLFASIRKKLREDRTYALHETDDEGDVEEGATKNITMRTALGAGNSEYYPDPITPGGL
jgi:hypothetical protein